MSAERRQSGLQMLETEARLKEALEFYAGRPGFRCGLMSEPDEWLTVAEAAGRLAGMPMNAAEIEE